MVGGLVEQQQIRSLKQQLAQCHTTALATGAHAHRRIRIRALQSVHGLLELGVEIPTVGRVDIVLQLAHFFHQRVEIGVRIGHFLANLVETRHLFGDRAECHLDVLADGLGVIQRRFLLQNADGETRGQVGFAVGNGVEAGHNLQQRGLTHAVRADDADLRARQEAQGHIVKNHSVAVSLAGLDHLVNKLSQCCVPSLRNVGIPAFCVCRSMENRTCSPCCGALPARLVVDESQVCCELIEAKCFRTVSIRKVPSPIIPYPVYTAVVGRLCGNGSVPPYVVGGDGGLLRRSPSLGVSVCLCVRDGTELRCRRREGSPGVVPVGAVAVILRGEIGFSRTGYVSTV